MRSNTVIIPRAFALLLAIFASLTQAATGPSAVDAGVISGLGARNIGSAAMSGRIAALDFIVAIIIGLALAALGLAYFDILWR